MKPNPENLASDPKFTVRYTLGLFLVANWIYNTLVVGQDGIADFSTISNEVFNDKMFFVGAFKQIQKLTPDINDPKIMEEMLESKTFLLNKEQLKDMSSLDETKMKSLAETGVSVYDMILTKKLAENTIFDEAVVPESYTTIDGSDKSVTDLTIPLFLVFSVDSSLLDKLSRLLDLSDKTIVSDVLNELKQDEKTLCFSSTFKFLEKIDSK